MFCINFKMIFLRSIFFKFIIAPLIGILLLISLPLLLWNRNVIYILTKLYAGFVIKMLRLVCGVHVKLEGKELLPSGPFILAANHQSAFETFFFAAILEKQASVVKKELLYIPVYNIYLILSDMVFIDRSAGISAIKKIQKAARHLLLSEKRPLVIFPQGTRTEVGEERDFLPGLAAICSAAPEVPIFGAALNSGRLWNKHSFNIKPGTVTIQIFACPKQDSARSTVNHLQSLIYQRCRALD